MLIMKNPVFIEYPDNFSFSFTIRSHGWYDLPPFELDKENDRLTYVFRTELGAASAALSDAGGRLRVDIDGEIDTDTVVRDVRHLLRLDDDLAGFYDVIRKHGRVGWVLDKNAGRLLRSPTVFEDLVKTICTTNCSWSLTRKMVANLVESLGQPTANGKKSFPTAEAMAAMPVEFYRDEIRAGYRSPYFVELADRVASGELDPERWLDSELSTADLKKEMKTVKGVGDYAAENLLKLVGRYDGLALDSWLRSQYYSKYNGGKKCADKKIEKHYNAFGVWRGLAIWCDMTEDWFDAS